MITEGIAEHAGYQTRTFRCEGDQPTIVLLHGMFDRAETWTGVLSELARLGHSAVAVDLPGYGAADRLAPGPALPQLDAFVADLVAAEGRDHPVVLVGNSLGGALAVRAGVDPDLPIAAIVPIDSAGFGARPWVEVALGRYSPPARVVSRLPFLQRAGHSPTFARLVARSVSAQSAAADPAVVGHFAEMVGGEGEVARLAIEGRSMLRELFGCLPLGEVPPMLIMHGRRDFLVPPSASVKMHLRFPGSKLMLLEHCGHCPQLDDPALVAEAVAELAGRAAAPAGQGHDPAATG